MEIWKSILEICVETLMEPCGQEGENWRGALLDEIIETLDGAMVLADCHAEMQGGDFFRDNNDNYLRLSETLRIFKAARKQ